MFSIARIEPISNCRSDVVQDSKSVLRTNPFVRIFGRPNNFSLYSFISSGGTLTNARHFVTKALLLFKIVNPKLLMPEGKGSSFALRGYNCLNDGIRNPFMSWLNYASAFANVMAMFYYACLPTYPCLLYVRHWRGRREFKESQSHPFSPTSEFIFGCKRAIRTPSCIWRLVLL